MTQVEQKMIEAYFREKGYVEAVDGFIIDNNTAEDVEDMFYKLTGVSFADCDEDMIKAVYSAFFNGYYEKKAEDWAKCWANKQKADKEAMENEIKKLVF